MKNVLAGLITLLLLTPPAHAAMGPSLFNFDGVLMSPGGMPVTSSNVGFRIQIMDKSGACVLYTEYHLSQNLSTSNGAFSFLVGTGTSQTNNLAGGSALTNSIFKNTGGPSGAFTGCPSGITTASGDERLLRVSFDVGGGMTVMTPDFPITSTPYAMMADSLQGKGPSDFLQVPGTTALTQANLESVFSGPNFAELTALLNGTSTRFVGSTPSSSVSFNNQTLTNVAAPVAATDAANKAYVDSSLTNINAASITSGQLSLAQLPPSVLTSTPGPSAVNLGTNNGNPVNFMTNNVARMTITPSGKVGIGTASPLGFLAVHGASGNPAVSGGADPALIHRVSGPSNAIDMGVNDSWASGWIQTRVANITGTVARLNINPLGGAVQIGSYSAPMDSQQLTVVQNGTTDALVVKGNTDNLITLQDNSGMAFTVFRATGEVGIGTTTPIAPLDVRGHIANSGPPATVTACGTGGNVTGNDTRGTVTVGTGVVTSCTVNFAMSFAGSPHCVVSWAGASAPAAVLSSSTSNSALTLHFSTGISSALVNYICMQ